MGPLKVVDSLHFKEMFDFNEVCTGDALLSHAFSSVSPGDCERFKDPSVLKAAVRAETGVYIVVVFFFLYHQRYHRTPVRSVTAPAATRSLKKSFSALMSCTTWETRARDH